MQRKKDRLLKRDEFVRQRFKHYKRKHPKWNTVYWITAVADEVFLSEVTVAKILKGTTTFKIPSHPTIAKGVQQLQQVS